MEKDALFKYLKGGEGLERKQKEKQLENEEKTTAEKKRLPENVYMSEYKKDDNTLETPIAQFSKGQKN